MKRIYVSLTDEQHAALRGRLVALGVPVSEQIRRAVNLMLFADANLSKKAQRDADIRKLLEKEPELAVHFPGYKPSAEQPLFPAQESEA